MHNKKNSRNDLGKEGDTTTERANYHIFKRQLIIMDKEKIMEELNLVREEKRKAVEAKNYEISAKLRDEEKELMILLEKSSDKAK